MKLDGIRVLVLVLTTLGFDAGAQSPALDAPMHPIGKSTDTASRCLRCPPADAKEPGYQPATDRSAPEYAGAHTESVEMQPTEPLTGDLVGTAATLPLPLQLR